MKIPRKLKIGAHLYKIELVKVPKEIDAENVAKTNKQTGIITIDSELINSEIFATLLHEIFHVLNGELKEEVVESLSQQLAQVFLDNKMVK